jgi:hypothetical protein
MDVINTQEEHMHQNQPDEVDAALSIDILERALDLACFQLNPGTPEAAENAKDYFLSKAHDAHLINGESEHALLTKYDPKKFGLSQHGQVQGKAFVISLLKRLQLDNNERMQLKKFERGRLL